MLLLTKQKRIFNSHCWFTIMLLWNQLRQKRKWFFLLFYFWFFGKSYPKLDKSGKIGFKSDSWIDWLCEVFFLKKDSSVIHGWWIYFPWLGLSRFLMNIMWVICGDLLSIWDCRCVCTNVRESNSPEWEKHHPDWSPLMASLGIWRTKVKRRNEN